jgi:hypothetical protein
MDRGRGEDARQARGQRCMAHTGSAVSLCGLVVGPEVWERDPPALFPQAERFLRC